MWEIARVIHCHDASLEEELTAVYVPTGFLKYRQILLLRCKHHFKSDLINNMEHMRISGTESSSVILSQKSSFKSWNEMTKIVANKLKPKGMV